jgi:hypothetical protein
MNLWIHPSPNVDNLARHLIKWGALARSMPPAWNGACISQPVGGDLGMFGRMLPGKGLLLDLDLKNVGVRRPLPYVYDRSPILRLTDKWHRRKWSDRARNALAANHIGYSSDSLNWLLSQRGAVSTYDGIIAARAALTGAPLDIVQYKPSVTTVAAQWHSLMMLAGTPAAATITTTNGAIMTSANAGAFSLPWGAASSSTNRYLLSFGFAAVQIINMALLVDILWAGGSYSVAASGTTSITQPALTRNTTGAGVMLTTEVTTVFNGTAATMQFNYTSVPGAAAHNTGGLPVRSTAAIVSMLQPSVSGSAANNIPWAPLASGDYGLTAITALVMAGTAMGSTSAVNAYAYFPLLWMPGVAANMYIERDSTTQIDGLIALAQDTSYLCGCLNCFVETNTTSTGIWNSFMRSCVG